MRHHSLAMLGGRALSSVSSRPQMMRQKVLILGQHQHLLTCLFCGTFGDPSSPERTDAYLAYSPENPSDFINKSGMCSLPHSVVHG